MHSIIGGQLEQSLAISIGHQIIKDVHLSNLEIICQNISSSLLLLSTVNAGQVLFCPKIYCSSLIFQNPSKMASLTKPPKQPLFWTQQKILHIVWKSKKVSFYNIASEASYGVPTTLVLTRFYPFFWVDKIRSECWETRHFWVIFKQCDRRTKICQYLNECFELSIGGIIIIVLSCLFVVFNNWQIPPSSSLSWSWEGTETICFLLLQLLKCCPKLFWRRQNKVTALYLCVLINALIFFKLMWLLMMQMCRPKITVVWDVF